MSGTCHLAKAMQDLEGDVCDVRSALMVLETIMDATFPPGERVKREIPELSSLHRIHGVNEEQQEQVDYALHHLGGLVRHLHRTYFAALESGAAP